MTIWILGGISILILTGFFHYLTTSIKSERKLAELKTEK
jgi:hypothetical protein